MSTMTGRGDASPRVARRRGLGVSVSTTRLAVVATACLALLLAWLSRREPVTTGYLYGDPAGGEGGWQW